MPKRLAEIVIDAGLAGREQVIEAAHAADEHRLPLVAALVHHGSVDELALVAAIKRQVRIAMIDPALARHDPEAMREIPQEVCRRLRIMPLAVSLYDTGTRVLRLAMADPTDAIAIAEVEHITGCQVESALMPLSAVEEMVETGYRSFITEVMRRKPPAPAEAAAVAKAAAPAPADEPVQPSTVPFHRVSDEASLEVRHRALLELLLEKRVFDEQEYEEHIRLLMKQRDGKA